MLAAIRDAIPSGEVQRTAVTILPITILKTCIDEQQLIKLFRRAQKKTDEQEKGYQKLVEEHIIITSS